MMIAGGVIGGVRTEVLFGSGAGNTTAPVNNLTVTDQNLGPAHPSRQMIVLVRGVNANVVSDQNYTTGVTVGGVAAARKIALPAGNNNVHVTAWITPRQNEGGPSGTTGTVVVSRSTGNGFTSSTGFLMFAAYGLRESDPVDFDYHVNAGSVTLALAGGGIMTAMAIGVPGEIAWGGATEVYDAPFGVSGANQLSGALISGTSASPGYSVTAANDSGTQMLAVSWR